MRGDFSASPAPTFHEDFGYTPDAITCGPILTAHKVGAMNIYVNLQRTTRFTLERPDHKCSAVTHTIWVCIEQILKLCCAWHKVGNFFCKLASCVAKA